MAACALHTLLCDLAVLGLWLDTFAFCSFMKVNVSCCNLVAALFCDLAAAFLSTRRRRLFFFWIGFIFRVCGDCFFLTDFVCWDSTAASLMRLGSGLFLLFCDSAEASVCHLAAVMRFVASHERFVYARQWFCFCDLAAAFLCALLFVFLWIGSGLCCRLSSSALLRRFGRFMCFLCFCHLAAYFCDLAMLCCNWAATFSFASWHKRCFAACRLAMLFLHCCFDWGATFFATWRQRFAIRLCSRVFLLGSGAFFLFVAVPCFCNGSVMRIGKHVSIFLGATRRLRFFVFVSCF